MIEYHYETDFKLPEPEKHTEWIKKAIASRGYGAEDLRYIFCSDAYLLDINKRFLNHDYYTDIITFPEDGGGIRGDIFISTERVSENAKRYKVPPEEEMRRVMIHGVLHLGGLADATREQQEEMRREEDALLKLFHVKHG